ncbi:MAG: hypothetical protein V9E99_15205 [Microthrixaceae bacterium]
MAADVVAVVVDAAAVDAVVVDASRRRSPGRMRRRRCLTPRLGAPGTHEHQARDGGPASDHVDGDSALM